MLQDPRPNSEQLLVWGRVEDNNPNDCLYIEASLVRADRLFQAKQEILASQGLGLKEQFPVYQDRMPVQLMAYLRLSRMQNAAELAAVGALPPCWNTDLMAIRRVRCMMLVSH